MIRCKINGNVYRLSVLLTKNEKQEGLKNYRVIPKNTGVIFVYDKDRQGSYDFSEIGYECKILFLDSRFKVIHSENTIMYQDRLVNCPAHFRYVIEVSK